MSYNYNIPEDSGSDITDDLLTGIELEFGRVVKNSLYALDSQGNKCFVDFNTLLMKSIDSDHHDAWNLDDDDEFTFEGASNETMKIFIEYFEKHDYNPPANRLPISSPYLMDNVAGYKDWKWL